MTFDFLNDKVCQFCHQPFIRCDKEWSFEHWQCPKRHMLVLYVKDERQARYGKPGQWVSCYVFLDDGRGLWLGASSDVFRYDQSSSGGPALAEFPSFNPFVYSMAALTDKLKLLMVFS